MEERKDVMELTTAKPKRKKHMLACIITGTIVVLLGLLVWLAGPARLVNLFQRTFHSNKSYYTWVEKNNCKAILDVLLSSDEEEKNLTADISLSLGSGIGNLLSITEPIVIHANLDQNEKESFLESFVSYGDNDVLAMNSYTNEDQVYINFPELSDKYVKLKNQTANVMLSSVNFSKLTTYVSKYLKEWITACDVLVELKDDEEFTIDDTTVKGSKVIVTYNVVDALKQLSLQLANMKEEEGLIQSITNDELSEADVVSVLDQLIQIVDDLRMTTKDDATMVMTGYIDGSGKMTGRSIELSMDNTKYRASIILTSDVILLTVDVNGANYFNCRINYKASNQANEFAPISKNEIQTLEEYKNEVSEESITQYINRVLSLLHLSDFVVSDEVAADKVEEDLPMKVTLGIYKGIEITMPQYEVSQEDIEEEIIGFTQYYSDMLPITDRDTVENGDLVDLDFIGKVDGEAFDGGTASNYELEIGSNMSFEGFEASLIGAKVGETITVNVVLPDTYSNQELAGKEAEFTVTINAIGVREFTDAFVAYNTEFETVEEYRDYVYQGLLETNEYDVQSALEEEIIQKVVENATFENVSQTEIDQQVETMLGTYEYYADYYGVTLEDFVNASLGMTMDDFYEEINYYADLYVKEKYVLAEIAQVEGLLMTDEEYEQRLEETANHYGYESGQVLEDSYGGREQIEPVLLEEKVIEFLRENALIKN